MKKLIILSGLTALVLFSALSLDGSSVNAQTQNIQPTVQYVFSNDLTLGSRGADVEQLQSWLMNSGYSIPSVASGAAARGYFGTQTQAALIAYQRSMGLPAYGFFGPMTRQYFNRGGQVNPAGPLRVTSPNGGESWQRGTVHNITWTSPYYIRATYADIKLVPRNTCTGQVCTMMYRMPYTIAKNISINQNSYSWRVGDYRSDIIPIDYPAGTVPSSYAQIPDGQYTIQICEVGSSACAESSSYFNIYSSGQGNTQPVINGIDAPTTLSVGQVGTWTVRATDPLNGTLSYSVLWGDEANYAVTAGMPMTQQVMQSSTFTHSYANAGVYTVTFTVRNSSGGTVQTSSTVTVTGSGVGDYGINVISPNGGEVWIVGENRAISWKIGSFADSAGINLPQSQTFDIYLAYGGCPLNSLSSGLACPAYYPSPQIIARNISGLSYSWTVGTLMSNTGVTGSYKIMVCPSGSVNYCGQSVAPFTINSSVYSSTPDINIVSPNGGETWYSGETRTISFNITGDPSRIGNNVTAYLVGTNNQQVYLASFSQNIFQGIRTFNVSVPSNISAGSYKLLVNLFNGSQQQAYDYSDNYFIVSNNYSYQYPGPYVPGYPVPSPVNCPVGFICTPNM